MKRQCILPVLMIASGVGGIAGAAQEPAAPQAPKPHVHFPHDGTPGNLLTKLTQDRSEDPLRFIAGDMHVVVTDLSAYKTDKPVQVKEEKVVAQLDELIRQPEKACKSGSGGGPTRPSRSPAPSSPAAPAAKAT